MAMPSDYCGGVEAYMYLGDLGKPLAPDSSSSSKSGRDLGHEANHSGGYSSPLRYDFYEFECYCLV